jgi:DNA-binding GntR family transcriptional regulator
MPEPTARRGSMDRSSARGSREQSPVVSRLARLHGAPSQQAVVDELRRVILAGDVPPGTAIPLDEVAALFQVSLIPVRESLKVLIGEGLVEHRPRAGYTVALLTRTELQELYVARGVLENALLAVAVRVARPSDHRRAWEAHQLLGAALRDADHPAYHRESRRFHFALVAPARMRRLEAMVESAWNLTEPYQPMAHISDAERAQLHDDHGVMLEVFTAGDTSALLEMASTHHDRLLAAVAAMREGTPRVPGSHD